MLVPFTGVTTTYADGTAPACAEDLEVTTTGYVRWPDVIRPLMRPPAKARYLPNRHTLSSKELELELICEPLVHAPAHALPIEYMEGPCRYRGTMGGRPVTGFGIAEATNAMYRDWELVDVLATQLARKDPESQNWESTIEELRSLIARRDSADALAYLDREMRPILTALPDDDSGELLEILDDLADAVREGLT